MRNPAIQENIEHLMTPEVLLVDDNAIQAATRNTILSRAGLRVSVASTPSQALELLQRADFQHSIRLMITDHLMPGMNGPELVGRVRQLLPELPVLVLSGLPGAEEEYASIGVSFQLKPFPPEDLIRLTRLLLGDSMLRSA